MQNLSSIRELRLEKNKLNGTSLTQSIGLLSKLEVLDLSSNSMSGVISDIHFLTLSKLWFLEVSYNSFTSEVSSNWVPPFQLKVLIMRSCKMGPHFPQWIQTQNRITYLDISDNGISDAISDSFWKLPPELRYLNLSSNLITGEVSKLPSLLVPDNVFPTIDLSSNRFHGAIPQLPRNITVLNLARNRFSGTISNLCSSSSENLMYLDLSNNFLSGELPDCWMHFPIMEIINLANNNFSGTIHTSFGQMPLASLQLRNNSFSGELPPSLANCISLQLVDVGENRLSGRIPAWIGESLSNLIVPRFRSNRFHGSIPKQICNLSSIQILDLSHNFFSGSIPWCLSNFTAMVKKDGSVPIFSSVYYRLDPTLPTLGWFYMVPYVGIVKIAWKGVELEHGKTLSLVKCIDLSCNNFSGEIPSEITSLVALISLNLSHNQLSGVIPGRINHMKSLESLDLSANHLSGRLPEGLRDLNFLSYLNLSDNNLSGKIPTSTQLLSFSNTSFQGNAGLCGKPLPNSCPGEEDEAEDHPSVDGGSKNVDKQGGKDEIISSGFYLSMGAGFATGFWAVCGSSLLYRPWRHAYFRFLDTIGDWFYVRALARLHRIISRFQV